MGNNGLTTTILHADRRSSSEHGAIHKPMHPSSKYAFADARDHPSYRGTSQGRCVERDRSRIPDLQTNRTSIPANARYIVRSEEHTSELQSLMRISYAVFCLKKKTKKRKINNKIMQ